MQHEKERNKFIMIDLGKRIRELRMEKGLTKEQLAASIGSTSSVISDYEHDEKTPSYLVLLNA